jgi:predicted transcriptional regulator
MGDREKILAALREGPLALYEIMKRANISNEQSCQSLLLKLRDEGSVKFDIYQGRWLFV